MIHDIETIKDVKRFIFMLIEEGVEFHPDEDFKNIINIQTKNNTYSNKESKLRNRLNKKCFLVCSTKNVDYYDLVNKIYLKETKLNRFIPIV